MKGISNVVWIVIAFILGLIILIALVSMTVSGKKTTDVTFSQTDLINCCDNCWANSGGPLGVAGVMCPTQSGNTRLTDISTKLGVTITKCEDIPFCKRG